MARKMNRRDWTTHECVEYEIPDNWIVSSYETDVNTVVNCATCGKSLTYGDAWLSWEIFDDRGLAYAVCKECFDEECKRRDMDVMRTTAD